MAAKSPTPAVPCRVVTLDNGLRVAVHEVHSTPLVSVWTWYRVGSGDEAPGLTGISHWVEHMNFKGTAHIPAEEMKTIVERFGGTWNGYTWIDQTAYFQTASRDALDRMLFIEAERMHACLYDPAECESERTVIISELQGSENDPEQLLDVEVTAAALKAHPYRHPTIGWLPDLQSMTRDDLFAHYRRYYTPANATLVIVGDVDREEAIRAAERAFGAIPSGTAPCRRRIVEPAQLDERRVVVEREGAAAYLKVAWPAPSATDPDFGPMLLLDAVLTGAKGVNLWASYRTPPAQRKARLYQALVERQLASSVSGSLLPTREPFLYTLSCTASDGVTLADVEGAALAAIERVRKNGVTDAELARARRQLRARFVYENDSVTHIAHQIGYFDVVSSLEHLASLESALAEVTAADVSNAAVKWLAPGRRTVGRFQPAHRQALAA